MSSNLNLWLAEVFSHPSLPGALAIAAKTAVVYLALIVGLRVLGKRELGQMSVYDLVLIVVIANAVQNAMIGDDSTLGGGLTAALVLLVLNRLLTTYMLRHGSVKHWLVGEPVLVVRDGHLVENAMRREGLTRDHILAAMREHGIAELDGVQMAVLEVDGSISIVPKESQTHRTRRRFRGLRIA